MRFARQSHALPALGLGLALSTLWPSTLLAQGLPPSSGSGAGTGTGMSSGFPGSTGTGRESSSGLGTTGTGREGMLTSPMPGGFPNPNLTTPRDRRGVGSRTTSGPGGMSTVSPDLFLDARSVNDPGERALALVRIAQTAIFSRQLDEAHTALFEAGPAALAERNPLIREQRLTAIIDSLLNLAEERMGESQESPVTDPIDDKVPTPPSPSPSPSPSVPMPAPSPGRAATAPVEPPPPQANALPAVPRIKKLRDALPEWAQAVELATRIDQVTPRTESLFRIVESEAFSSQRLITDPLRGGGGGRPEAPRDPEIRGFIDGLLASSWQHALMIERPIWRDYAAFSIISNAANSSQFTRGFQIARAIEQPEARTDALIRLAEGQALNGQPNQATAAYEEAARSVALIPQDDPRETLIGVLIDSLISFGRFDDARACVPLYAFRSRQLTALLAVAESQGRRNLAESARLWIAREDPSFQPLLYRKVNDGILAAIERNRSNELSDRGR